MPLVLQIVGVCAALWSAQKVFQRYFPKPEALSAALLAVPSALAAVIAAGAVWPGISGMWRDANQNSRLSTEQAAVAGSPLAGARADFLAWVVQEIPSNATFYLTASPTVSLWATYQLLPRRQVPAIGQAQWLVLYDSSASSLGPAAHLFEQPMSFASGYSIARRRR